MIAVSISPLRPASARAWRTNHIAAPKKSSTSATEPPTRTPTVRDCVASSHGSQTPRRALVPSLHTLHIGPWKDGAQPSPSMPLRFAEAFVSPTLHAPLDLHWYAFFDVFFSRHQPTFSGRSASE